MAKKKPKKASLRKIKNSTLPSGKYYIGDVRGLYKALKQSSSTRDFFQSDKFNAIVLDEKEGAFEFGDVIFFVARPVEETENYGSYEAAYPKKLKPKIKGGEISIDDGLILVYPMPPASELKKTAALTQKSLVKGGSVIVSFDDDFECFPTDDDGDILIGSIVISTDEDEDEDDDEYDYYYDEDDDEDDDEDEDDDDEDDDYYYDEDDYYDDDDDDDDDDEYDSAYYKSRKY